MYLAVVLLTMLLLPLASVEAEHVLHPDLALPWLFGRWFVFWGVGVRLALAGARQYLQPTFTAREIFHASGDEVLVVVRELGIANMAAAAIALLAVKFTGFVVPAAVYGTLFYGIAGIRHLAERGRSANENVAMVSDLLIASVLAAFLATRS